MGNTLSFGSVVQIDKINSEKLLTELNGLHYAELR
jgi:hypothetical protein